MSVEPQRTPQSQAAYWFTHKRAGDLSADQLRLFDVWLGQSVQNRAAYDELERMWSFVGGVEDDPAILDMRDRDERMAGANSALRSIGVVLASFALIAGGGYGLSKVGVLPEVTWFDPPPAQEFRTTVGQRATVTLLDHSVVMLDTDTALRVRFTGGKRMIELHRGQAFFQVAKDKSRPFIVAAAGKTVRATGTAFDVRVEPGRFEVTLIEGRVRVEQPNVKRADTPMADMRAGWRLAVGNDERWRIEPVDLTKATGWHNGTLNFYYQPLSSAVAEMNRYSNRKIVFSGDPPKTVVIGSFRAGDVENFVRAVELYKLARISTVDPDHIELAAR